MTAVMENGTVQVERSDFVPIPQLAVSDGDLLVIFLAADGVFFLEKTDDPWYQATDPLAIISKDGRDQVMYWSDEAASPMGCVQRYQYCNSGKKCGILGSLDDAVNSAWTLFNGVPGEYGSSLDPYSSDVAEISRFYHFINTLYTASNIYDMVSTLGPFALLSPQQLSGGLMGPLADNQWQLDISHWFAIRMASIQAAVVNTARGPNDKSLLQFFNVVSDESQLKMCKNQVSKVFLQLIFCCPQGY